MNQTKSLPMALFFLRLSVFVVFLMWTLDKFIRPDHTASVFEAFYFSPTFGAAVSYAIGAVELLLILGFLVGFKKKLTYGAVLVLHLISTVSTYAQYLAPYEEINLLFFTAWPMLAACYALYVLRDHDTIGTFSP